MELFGGEGSLVLYYRDPKAKRGVKMAERTFEGRKGADEEERRHVVNEGARTALMERGLVDGGRHHLLEQTPPEGWGAACLLVVNEGGRCCLQNQIDGCGPISCKTLATDSRGAAGC